VHLIAVGSSIASRLSKLGLGDVDELRARVAGALGGQFRVTADRACWLANEDDRRGGRTDDVRRARDLQRALGDDRVAAIVALAGGAWFTRVLRRIDFGVLQRRTTRVHLFGSSEMTPLINIAGRYRQAIGVHDVMPVFLLDVVRPKRRAASAFDACWADVARMISGNASSRVLTGTLLSGRLPGQSTIRVVGGNLTLVAAMMGGPFARVVSGRGRWLALEDINEKPERIDRMLAQLRMAGALDGLEGVLLGDFHRGKDDLHDAVVSLLRFHIPTRAIPVVGRCNFGHIWPAAPLPLHRPLQMTRRGREVRINASTDATSRDRSPVRSQPSASSSADSGVYRLWIDLRQGARLNVGRLGRYHLKKGTYVYVGSARRHLAARLARHRRSHKTLRWHVDYLLALPGAQVRRVEIKPWRKGAECRWAGQTARQGGRPVIDGFGASDCCGGCGAHLFMMPE